MTQGVWYPVKTKKGNSSKKFRWLVITGKGEQKFLWLKHADGSRGAGKMVAMLEEKYDAGLIRPATQEE